MLRHRRRAFLGPVLSSFKILSAMRRQPPEQQKQQK